jgi:ATP-dependent Clp protease ATP-binding subunit ClpC
MSIVFSTILKKVLSQKGYYPVFGARPLKRATQKYIQDPLSRKILEGEFTEGDQINVIVDKKSKKISL